MGLFDKFKKKEKPENIGPMFLYSEKEQEEGISSARNTLFTFPRTGRSTAKL